MPAKFCQLAVAATTEGDSIYALDADGHVWGFNADLGQWEPLPPTRGEPAESDDYSIGEDE
jgi:hypothetical protein